MRISSIRDSFRKIGIDGSRYGTGECFIGFVAMTLCLFFSKMFPDNEQFLNFGVVLILAVSVCLCFLVPNIATTPVGICLISIPFSAMLLASQAEHISLLNLYRSDLQSIQASAERYRNENGRVALYEMAGSKDPISVMEIIKDKNGKPFFRDEAIKRRLGDGDVLINVSGDVVNVCLQNNKGRFCTGQLPRP